MLITDHKKKHYIAIKSLRRLLSRKNSKHKESQHFCTNCLQGFAEIKSRDEHCLYCKSNEAEHYLYCKSNEAVRIEMLVKKLIVEYSDGQYQFKVPFTMYTDFESILELIQGASNDPNVEIRTWGFWCSFQPLLHHTHLHTTAIVHQN